MINIPRGTKDVLPNESYRWQYVEHIAREVAHCFNVREIRTPAFEHTELFLRSIGEGTDVVSKEMYTFLDKGDRSITLKPEGTAPVARSYVENNLEALSLPLKMFYFSPVFRYERPASGRYREHHQFGVEVYGSNSPFTDGEVIEIAYTFLRKIGLTGVKLNVSSIGCPTCREEYNVALKAFLEPHLGELCPTCRERYEKNPLRTIDCKVESCKKIVQNAPRIIDYICDDCSSHLEALKKYLEQSGIPYVVDSSIVRGLDYYTKNVFEFTTDMLGAQSGVCGGGRYDNLVSSVGGKSTPCVGFGIGLERVLLLLEKAGVEIPNCNIPAVFVMAQNAELLSEATALVRKLRLAGLSADTDYTGKSVKSQFKFANRREFKYSIVIGQSEIESGNVKVKNMAASSETEVAIDSVVEYITQQIK